MAIASRAATEKNGVTCALPPPPWFELANWPMIAIDGRFLTSPGMIAESGSVSGNEALQGTLQVMDKLVARAKADKK